jgi:hypothetical protein
VKGEKGKYQLVVSDKSWKKLKQKLKTITRKTTPMSFDERIQKLNEIQRGWVNNFRMASIYGKLKELDGWMDTQHTQILHLASLEKTRTEKEKSNPLGNRPKSRLCLE